MSSGQTIGASAYARAINRTPPSQIKFIGAKKEKKKMGWFKRKFAQWARDAWENENEYSSERLVGSGIGAVHDECITTSRNTEERITLRLEKAIGGHIVSVSKYNSRIDRHRENTYLIRDDDSLEEALTAVFIQEKLNQ